MILTLSQVRPIPTPLPRPRFTSHFHGAPAIHPEHQPLPWSTTLNLQWGWFVNYAFPRKNSNLQSTPNRKLSISRSQNVNFRMDGPCKLIEFATKVNVYKPPPLGEPCFARRKLINFRFANGAICELMVTEWTVFVN